MKRAGGCRLFQDVAWILVQAPRLLRLRSSPAPMTRAASPPRIMPLFLLLTLPRILATKPFTSTFFIIPLTASGLSVTLHYIAKQVPRMASEGSAMMVCAQNVAREKRA